METKTLYAIIIAAILGAALGFGLSYITFNSQIQSLQREVRVLSEEYVSLSSTVTSIGNTVDNLITSLDAGLDDLQAQVRTISLRLLQIQELSNKTIHTFTLHWELVPIQSGLMIEGYVKNWTVTEGIRILQVDVWMGNPYNITWEGDVFVAVNNTANLWNPSIDEVIVHYQVDSHVSPSLPHIRSFDLRPGFQVDANQTLFVYRLFNNFDEKDTTAGDGWVRLYYIAE